MELRKFMIKIGIIGSGNWSLALSKVLISSEVTIKARNIDKAKKKFPKNKKFFIIDNFEILKDFDVLFLANPSQSLRGILNEIPKNTKSKFVICSKGIEKKTNKLMSEVLTEFFPKNDFAILSGPNFSFEVIKGLPTATVISSKNSNLSKYISKIMVQEKFRTYFNNDIIGTQIGGAMKNVIAIASGFIIGKGLGLNANASIITRGPNFSFEVIKGLPTATVISSKNSNLSKYISKIMVQEKFRTYFNNDIIGTQIGGAMKNVIAIASGFIIGKGLGLNANASIITRGLSEIIDLGIKMGAKKKTFYGLSGIGDLSLTCSSLKSRNTKLGYLLAKRKKGISGEVIEGMESCESVCALGKKFNVELPICNSVKKILSGHTVEKIMSNLLSRPLQFEK